MPSVKVWKIDGSDAGRIKLKDEVFGIEVSEPAIHQVVVAQLAANRQGTQSTLTRSEVRGGGKKPWRQKGTGRARHGSTREPQWTGGGVVFSPKPRSYRVKVNKKMKQLAMRSALSMKVAEKELVVVEEFNIEAPKTKEMVKALENIKVAGAKALIVTDAVDETVTRASGNIAGVAATFAGEMSVYDIVNCDKLVLTKAAVKKLEEVYA